MKTSHYFIILLLFISQVSISQRVDKKVLNWYSQGNYGMDTDNAYKRLLAGKKSTTVLVAVMDSGIGTEPEDLKGYIWTNEDEIPANGVNDEDKGYVDDI